MAEREVRSHVQGVDGDLEIYSPVAPSVDSAGANAKAATTDLQEAEKPVVSRPKLRVDNLLQRSESVSRVPTQERTAAVPFGITQLRINPAEARPGETVLISFKATNTSDVRSIYPVTLRVEGKVVAAEVVSVPPGDALPIYFTVVESLPGDYRVDVNQVTGRFAVIGEEVGSRTEELQILSAGAGSMEARFEPGLSEIGAYLERKKSPEKIAAPKPGGPQAAIDKAADYIEIGIDKIGDGLVFPIQKLVDLSRVIFKLASRKTRK